VEPNARVFGGDFEFVSGDYFPDWQPNNSSWLPEQILLVSPANMANHATQYWILDTPTYNVPNTSGGANYAPGAIVRANPSNGHLFQLDPKSCPPTGITTTATQPTWNTSPSAPTPDPSGVGTWLEAGSDSSGPTSPFIKKTPYGRGAVVHDGKHKKHKKDKKLKWRAYSEQNLPPSYGLIMVGNRGYLACRPFQVINSQDSGYDATSPAGVKHRDIQTFLNLGVLNDPLTALAFGSTDAASGNLYRLTYDKARNRWYLTYTASSPAGNMIEFTQDGAAPEGVHQVNFPNGLWIEATQYGATWMRSNSAPPTTALAPWSGPATWPQGTIFWNTIPIPGGYAGWACTTPGTATTPGTWTPFGLLENQDLLSMSVAGVAPGSNVTLTADEAAYARIRFTGALKGNGNISVIVKTPFVLFGKGPNSIQKIFQNQTTGLVTITVQATLSDGGVAIPQGSTQLLMSDGTTMFLVHS
jgi:hypothetical protein